MHSGHRGQARVIGNMFRLRWKQQTDMQWAVLTVQGPKGNKKNTDRAEANGHYTGLHAADVRTVKSVV